MTNAPSVIAREVRAMPPPPSLRVRTGDIEDARSGTSRTLVRPEGMAGREDLDALAGAVCGGGA